MNPILMANMQAIINQSMPPEKSKRKARLHKNSKSKQIIEYLLEHGRSTGEKIMKELSLSNSPQAYIQPHIKQNRVICKSIHLHKATYEINELMSRDDFGLK